MKTIQLSVFLVLLSFFSGCSTSSNSNENITVPELTTTAISLITTTDASTGGTITSDGSSTITARGVVWSTSTNPTIALTTKTSDATGTGSFSSTISGLTANTTYFVRAYATNSGGTGYGNEVTFTTTAVITLCGNVTDIDGNTYNVVSIGTQCWLQTNLNVTKYRNGDPIPQVTGVFGWVSSNTGAWCYYENNTANGATYGKLYNWYAVNDPRGLAPAGYHVASNAEWNTLITFLGGSTIAGGKMKATTGWNAPNTGATNSSGFTGLPGGRRSGAGSDFSDRGDFGEWWSSSEINTTNAWEQTLSSNDGSAISSDNNKQLGISVRCIKD